MGENIAGIVVKSIKSSDDRSKSIMEMNLFVLDCLAQFVGNFWKFFILLLKNILLAVCLRTYQNNFKVAGLWC